MAADEGRLAWGQALRSPVAWQRLAPSRLSEGLFVALEPVLAVLPVFARLALRPFLASVVHLLDVGRSGSRVSKMATQKMALGVLEVV